MGGRAALTYLLQDLDQRGKAKTQILGGSRERE